SHDFSAGTVPNFGIEASGCAGAGAAVPGRLARSRPSRERSNRTFEMKQSFVLLVVAICGLLLPMLVEQKTADLRVADNVGIDEWLSSPTSALGKHGEVQRAETTAPDPIDREVQRGEDRDVQRAETTAPGVEEPQSLPAMLPPSPAIPPESRA